MIEQLFGSKTRVKLLSLFYNNPGRPFYVREITRKIDEQINSVRRELANMLSIGIVTSDGANNRLYYEVNPKYEYYEQLRSIFNSMPVKTNRVLKETREEESIATKLRAAGKIDYAFLTGSYVRDPRTNVDLFVVGDVNKARLAKIVAEMEETEGREINYTALTPAEYEYRLSLNDRHVSSVMSAKKIVLIEAENEAKLDHQEVAFGERLGRDIPITVRYQQNDGQWS